MKYIEQLPQKTSGSITFYINSGLNSKKDYYYKVRGYTVLDSKKVYSSKVK
ncbi:hypothetical protein SDC9_201600 [bioreactor metagenome]|uniref:Fibronectin type-III domain-containing protein n=1 Tax=bioreactor metagenome TaxID=1076179 RepID=A0A645IRD7_9ZZZZ